MKSFIIVLLLITLKYGVAYKEYPDVNGIPVVISVDINDKYTIFKDTPMYFEMNKPYTTKERIKPRSKYLVSQCKPSSPI